MSLMFFNPAARNYLTDEIMYYGIQSPTIKDVVQFPVQVSSVDALNPNAPSIMIDETAKLSQDKIFQYFNNLPVPSGYIDKIAAGVNDPNSIYAPKFGDLFDSTTKLLGFLVLGYLLIK